MFFKERWYGFDDGLYSGARLLEILSRVANPSATLNALPADAFCTPELHYPLPPKARTTRCSHNCGSKPQSLPMRLAFTDAREIITLDGLRVEYADGFGLARPSNTIAGNRAALRSGLKRCAATHPGRLPQNVRQAAPQQHRSDSRSMANTR